MHNFCVLFNLQKQSQSMSYTGVLFTLQLWQGMLLLGL